MKRFLQNTRDLLLYVFALVFPFENWTPATVGGMSLTFLVSLAYFLTSLLELSAGAVRKGAKIGDYMVLLLLWTGVFLLSDTLGIVRGDTSTISFTVELNVLMTLFVAQHLLDREHKVCRQAANIYMTTLALQFVLFLLGVGVSLDNSEAAEQLSTTRFIVFGHNPNGLAVMACVCFCTALYRILFRRIRGFWPILWHIALMAAYTGLISATMSRGGLLALGLGLGLLSILFVARQPARKRLVSALPLLTAGALLAAYFLSIDAYMDRFVEEDATSGRGYLFQRHAQTFPDHPLLGAGMSAHKQVMQRNYGILLQSHNGYLDVLLFTGITGGILFLILFFKLLAGLLKSRKTNPLFPLGLTLFLLNFFDFGKSGGVIATKFFWLVIAFLIYFTRVPDAQEDLPR